MATILEFYFRFRFWPVYRHRHGILICLPNYVLIGRSELLPHIDFSTWRPWSRKSTSELRFSDGIAVFSHFAMLSPSANRLCVYNFWTDILQYKLPVFVSTCCYCYCYCYCYRTLQCSSTQHRSIPIYASFKISLFSLFFEYLFWVYYLYMFSYTNSSYLLSFFIQCLFTQHQPPPTCFRYSTIRSIQGSDKTTTGCGIRMATILEFYFRFRFWPVYRHWHVILICLPNFVLIGRSELLPHIDFSTWRPWSRKSTSELRFSDGICLRRWKFRWNISVHSDVCIVIAMSFCIWLPNFRSLGEL